MTKKVPSLEQYAYGSLPQDTHVPIQVIRSVRKKRSVIQPIKEQVQSKATKHRINIKTPELIQQLRRNLRVYLETQPVVGLDVLSNLYVLFQNNILKTQLLTQFSQSVDTIFLLKNYYYGDENICLLLKYSGRIYLVVLKGTYAELMRHQTMIQQNEQKFYPTQILHHAADNMLTITFAVAVKGTTPSARLPVPFQQDSLLPLSENLGD